MSMTRMLVFDGCGLTCLCAHNAPIPCSEDKLLDKERAYHDSPHVRNIGHQTAHEPGRSFTGPPVQHKVGRRFGRSTSMVAPRKRTIRVTQHNPNSLPPRASISTDAGQDGLARRLPTSPLLREARQTQSRARHTPSMPSPQSRAANQCGTCDASMSV